jgi:hypothetical protein
MYQVTDGEIEVKKLLGRLRSRWDSNIKVDLIGTGLDGVLNLFCSEQRQVAAVCENGNKLPDLQEMLEICRVPGAVMTFPRRHVTAGVS